MKNNRVWSSLSACAALAAAFLVATSSKAQPELPYDTTTVFKSHLPHLNSHTNGGGGGGGTGTGTSAKASFGGTPYSSAGTAVNPTTSVPEAEEHIAVDATITSNLVAAVSDFALRGGYNTTKYARSTDNGANWTEHYVPLDASNFPVAGGRSWDANSDPVVAIDSSGRAYVADLYFNCSGCPHGGNANGFYVTVLDSSGAYLSTSTVAENLSSGSTTSEDKEWITANGTNLYACWTRFVGNSDHIRFSRSTDQGASWSASIQISPTTQNGAVQGCQVAAGPSGVFVAYQVYYVGGQGAQYLAKSTNGGASFGTPVRVTPIYKRINFNSTYRKDSFAALAVSPTSGDVYMVYPDQPKSGGAEIEFVRSANSGATFSSPVIINDVSTGQQFFPAIAVDGTGNIHASWFDTRNGGGSSSLYDIYATISKTGGTTFAANTRVTATTMNAGNTSFIGDYAGVAAANGSAHPAWTNGGFASGHYGHLQTAALSY